MAGYLSCRTTMCKTRYVRARRKTEQSREEYINRFYGIKQQRRVRRPRPRVMYKRHTNQVTPPRPAPEINIKPPRIRPMYRPRPAPEINIKPPRLKPMRPRRPRPAPDINIKPPRLKPMR